MSLMYTVTVIGIVVTTLTVILTLLQQGQHVTMCTGTHLLAHLQDVADLLVETLIDAKKPVEQWDWGGLLEQVKYAHPPSLLSCNSRPPLRTLVNV